LTKIIELPSKLSQASGTARAEQEEEEEKEEERALEAPTVTATEIRVEVHTASLLRGGTQQVQTRLQLPQLVV
jgi:hypothetical protein